MRSLKRYATSPEMDIRNRFQKFIEENFLAGAGLDMIRADESLLENGIVDSTGVLELIDFLERTFQIKIKDEELVPDNLDTINKVVAFVQCKIESKEV